MTDTIDYGTLMHDAMRGLIRRVLSDVQEHGLPGSHHFFITFDTGHPDAKLADWLHERYPDDMTIVMQHYFEGLSVTDEGFSVTLNFGDSPEPLYIPFDAVQTFVDPSVEFGLRLSPGEREDEEDDEDALNFADEPEAPMDEAPEDAPHEADVVSLDQFRK